MSLFGFLRDTAVNPYQKLAASAFKCTIEQIQRRCLFLIFCVSATFIFSAGVWIDMYKSSRLKPLASVIQYYMHQEASDLLNSQSEASRHYFPLDENDTEGLEHLYNQLAYMTEAYNNTRHRKTKYILRVGGFNWGDWLEGRERFIVDDCPIKDCWLTSESNRTHTADALFITQINHNSVKAYLPKASHQIWIARHGESPAHNRIDPTSLRGLLNWTATYRKESTFFLPYHVPYGRKDRLHPMWHYRDLTIKARSPGPDGLFSSVNFAAGKTKKVAWFVSNCADRNGRLSYAHELAKYIDVDIYGGCGKLSCPKSECRTMLSQQYKFYLAFENSNCVGYITEKLVYQALLSDVLPIVMGAQPEDYLAIAPPHSYIHVDDFRRPQNLAQYLRSLDKNDTAYNEYFKWKDTWTAIMDKYWCRLCAALHMADDVGHSSYFADYSDWWNRACSARQSSDGSWQTWRNEGFWNATNSTLTF